MISGSPHFSGKVFVLGSCTPCWTGTEKECMVPESSQSQQDVFVPDYEARGSLQVALGNLNSSNPDLSGLLSS